MLGVVGLALTGCQASTSASGGYACAETGECPSGMSCVADRCVSESGEVDGPPGGGPDGGGEFVDAADDPDGGGGGPDAGGGGTPDGPLTGCFVEEDFSAPLSTAIWNLEVSGLATVDAEDELTMDVTGATGAAAARLSTDDAAHNYRGQSVVVTTSELPAFGGLFYFRLRYLQGGEPTTIGFIVDDGDIQALGTCPGCGGGAATFCEGAVATDDREFEFMRIDVTAASVEMLSSEDGRDWITRGTCSMRISGLNAARLELGLESTSVDSSSATVDDISVCATVVP